MLAASSPIASPAQQKRYHSNIDSSVSDNEDMSEDINIDDLNASMALAVPVPTTTEQSTVLTCSNEVYLNANLKQYVHKLAC
jgi:hypothetical protein